MSWSIVHRSSSLPAVQLYDVLLVVPHEELELVQALLQTVTVLHAHGILQDVLDSSHHAVQPAAVRHLQLAIREPCSSVYHVGLSMLLQYAAEWQVSPCMSSMLDNVPHGEAVSVHLPRPLCVQGIGRRALLFPNA